MGANVTSGSPSDASARRARTVVAGFSWLLCLRILFHHVSLPRHDGPHNRPLHRAHPDKRMGDARLTDGVRTLALAVLMSIQEWDGMITETIERINTATPHVILAACGSNSSDLVVHLRNTGIRASQFIDIAQDPMSRSWSDLERWDVNVSGSAVPYLTVTSKVQTRELLEGADILFLIAEVGSPEWATAEAMAKLARELEIITVCIAQVPEGEDQHDADLMKRMARSVMCFPHAENESPAEAIYEVVRGIVDVITVPSLINLDLADLKTILSYGDESRVIYNVGQGSSIETAIDSFNDQIAGTITGHPNAALIHIWGGPELTVSNVHTVCKTLTSQLENGAHVILGVRIDDNGSEGIRVLSIVAEEDHRFADGIPMYYT